MAIVFACGFVSAASAQQADGAAVPSNPLKSVMKLMGFATDPPQPQDFVLKSRPEKEDYIPVFQPPPEPARPVLKDKDLKTLQGDLDSVEKRADAARAGFPPAAAAVAEQKAQAAKARSKPKPANQ